MWILGEPLERKYFTIWNGAVSVCCSLIEYLSFLHLPQMPCTHPPLADHKILGIAPSNRTYKIGSTSPGASDNHPFMCGTGHSNTFCPATHCCSKNGECGTTDDYVSARVFVFVCGGKTLNISFFPLMKPALVQGKSKKKSSI